MQDNLALIHDARELCDAMNTGRKPIAEGNKSPGHFSLLKLDGCHFSFREKFLRTWH